MRLAIYSMIQFVELVWVRRIMSHLMKFYTLNTPSQKCWCTLGKELRWSQDLEVLYIHQTYIYICIYNILYVFNNTVVRWPPWSSWWKLWRGRRRGRRWAALIKAHVNTLEAIDVKYRKVLFLLLLVFKNGFWWGSWLLCERPSCIKFGNEPISLKKYHSIWLCI